MLQEMHISCYVMYLVRRIAHKRVIRLSIRGLITSTGSFGKAKNPKVACQNYHNQQDVSATNQELGLPK